VGLAKKKFSFEKKEWRAQVFSFFGSLFPPFLTSFLAGQKRKATSQPVAQPKAKKDGAKAAMQPKKQQKKEKDFSESALKQVISLSYLFLVFPSCLFVCFSLRTDPPGKRGPQKPGMSWGRRRRSRRRRRTRFFLFFLSSPLLTLHPPHCLADEWQRGPSH